MSGRAGHGRMPMVAKRAAKLGDLPLIKSDYL